MTHKPKIVLEGRLAAVVCECGWRTGWHGAKRNALDFHRLHAEHPERPLG